jgi:hypothetical protein
MSAAGQVEVDLEVSSWIEGRGVRHTDWSVRVNDSWVPIKELRNVGKTMAEPDFSFDDEVEELRVIPPGCQYRTTYHPRLTVGTQVQRRVSVPLVLPAPTERAAATPEVAFRQLMAAGHAPKLPLKTIFTDYRVTRRGLVTEETWQRRQQRATARGGAPGAEKGERACQSVSVSRAEIEEFARRVAKVG